MNSRLFKSDKFYYGLFVVMLIPALLINLGVHHIFIHTDESLRALIALEMLLNKEFIAPTVNGLYYFNKPPLYNWIIAASFKLFGEASLFALRFPVFLAILLYGVLIVKFIGKASSNRMGWFVAIATITCGRILFYDSFLGLIDIAFSTLIFTNFMLFYHLGKKEKYFALFATTYFLSALAYLMKGLPPIVFQGLTIIAMALFKKNWKILFHPSHFLGALFFVVPVAGYYLAYLQVNPKPLGELFSTLWSESSKRTVTDHGIVDSLKALYQFPLENLYHFAPWTVLSVFLFRKGAFKELWNEEFSRFLALVFGLNIVVYWTSPGVHPRYLFMFLPLLFFMLFQLAAKGNQKLLKGIQMLLLGIMAIGSFGPFIMMSPALELGVHNDVLKLVGLGLAMGLLTILFYKQRQRRWIILGIFLLTVRLAFNWFILPFRNTDGMEYTKAAAEVVEITKDGNLFIVGGNHLSRGSSFLIERERGEVLNVRDTVNAGDYYISIDQFILHNSTELYRFRTKSTDREMVLSKKN